MAPEMIGAVTGGLATGLAGALFLIKILVRSALNDFWLKLQDPEIGFLTRQLADARHQELIRRVENLEGARR